MIMFGYTIRKKMQTCTCNFTLKVCLPFNIFSLELGHFFSSPRIYKEIKLLERKALINNNNEVPSLNKYRN